MTLHYQLLKYTAAVAKPEKILGRHIYLRAGLWLGGVARGAKPPWKFFSPLEKCVGHSLKLLYIVLMQWQFIFRYDSYIAQEPGSLFWCHAVMSLQFTHVPSFACWGRLRNLRADCSTVVLYYVTIIWQRIFKGSLQVTMVGVLSHVTVERRHLWQVMQRDRVAAMGVGRIFSRMGHKVFFQNFSKGGQKWWNLFFTTWK